MSWVLGSGGPMNGKRVNKNPARVMEYRLYFTGWWFGTFFIFPSSWEEFSQLTFIFFRGVVLPPTSLYGMMG